MVNADFLTNLDMTDEQFVVLTTNFILALQHSPEEMDEEQVYEYIEEINNVYNFRENYINISNNTFNKMIYIIKSYFIRDRFTYVDSNIFFYDHILESLECLPESFKQEKLWELKGKEIIALDSKEEKMNFVNYYLNNPKKITKLYQVLSLLEVAIFINYEPMIRKIRDTFFNEKGEFLNAI